jgi:hypothetical protein
VATAGAGALRDRRQGIVRSVEADPDYTHRPEPETTLDALRKVVEAGG